MGWGEGVCRAPQVLLWLTMPSYYLKAVKLGPEKNQDRGMCAVEEGEWCITGGKKSPCTLPLIN